MFRLMIAATAAMLASSASASIPILLTDDGLHAHVRYGDLDLHSPEGRSRLTGRIRMAAEMLCLDPNSIQQIAARDKCYHNAVASGIGQMNEIASR